jgi:hypothetical protein
MYMPQDKPVCYDRQELKIMLCVSSSLAFQLVIVSVNETYRVFFCAVNTKRMHLLKFFSLARYVSNVNIYGMLL